jgi:hypothetical protein
MIVAKLNYERARRTKQSGWAYTARQPAKPIGPMKPNWATRAAFYSEISTLTRRIEDGKEKIRQLHPNDPRQTPWRNLLSTLYQQRRDLREGMARKDA